MRTLHFLTAAALVGVALAACDRAPAAPDAPAASAASHAHGSSGEDAAPTLTPLARRQLAELRAATARFHDLDAAAAAGFDTRLTDCMSDPALGGMGVHFGQMSRFDARPEHDQPEILVYEPQRNGKLRLVAVEFAVPFDAWTQAKPPVLFGQSFHRNETFGLWVLHAWIGRENPSGLFADWNPRVSCGAA